MKFSRFLLLPLGAAALLLAGSEVYSLGVVTAAQKERSAHYEKPIQFHYVCPMHDDVTSKTRSLS